MTTELADEGALREAVAYAVMAMVLADGRAEPAEIDHARAALARCRLFADNEVEEDRRLLDSVERQVREDGARHAARHADILAGSPWRYAAVAIMADIMAADGTMTDEEIAMIREAAQVFGIAETQAMAILRHVGTDAIEDLITGENLDASQVLMLDD